MTTRLLIFACLFQMMPALGFGQSRPFSMTQDLQGNVVVFKFPTRQTLRLSFEDQPNAHMNVCSATLTQEDTSQTQTLSSDSYAQDVMRSVFTHSQLPDSMYNALQKAAIALPPDKLAASFVSTAQEHEFWSTATDDQRRSQIILQTARTLWAKNWVDLYGQPSDSFTQAQTEFQRKFGHSLFSLFVSIHQPKDEKTFLSKRILSDITETRKTHQKQRMNEIRNHSANAQKLPISERRIYEVIAQIARHNLQLGTTLTDLFENNTFIVNNKALEEALATPQQYSLTKDQVLTTGYPGYLLAVPTLEDTGMPPIFFTSLFFMNTYDTKTFLQVKKHSSAADQQKYLEKYWQAPALSFYHDLLSMDPILYLGYTLTHELGHYYQNNDPEISPYLAMLRQFEIFMQDTDVHLRHPQTREPIIHPYEKTIMREIETLHTRFTQVVESSAEYFALMSLPTILAD